MHVAVWMVRLVGCVLWFCVWWLVWFAVGDLCKCLIGFARCFGAVFVCPRFRFGRGLIGGGFFAWFHCFD